MTLQEIFDWLLERLSPKPEQDEEQWKQFYRNLFSAILYIDFSQKTIDELNKELEYGDYKAGKLSEEMEKVLLTLPKDSQEKLLNEHENRYKIARSSEYAAGIHTLDDTELYAIPLKVSNPIKAVMLYLDSAIAIEFRAKGVK